MNKEVYTPKSVKVFGGPVSKVAIAGGFAFISGQISMDPVTGEIRRGTIEEETEQVLTCIKLVVEELGVTLDDVVKCDVYLSTMDDFAGMNSVYARYFGTEHPPARCAVTVAPWGGMKVEIATIVKL